MTRSRPIPQPAHEILVDFDATRNRDFRFQIDGTEFPWAIAGVELEPLNPNAMPVLVVRIPADRILLAHTVGGGTPGLNWDEIDRLADAAPEPPADDPQEPDDDPPVP